MANVLVIAGKVAILLILLLLGVLSCKTFEYFNKLHEENSFKPILSWDLLVLYCNMFFFIVKLVTM